VNLKLTFENKEIEAEIVEKLQNVVKLHDGRYVHLNCGHVWYPLVELPRVCPLCHTPIRKRVKLVQTKPAREQSGWRPLCTTCYSPATIIVSDKSFCWKCLRKWAKKQEELQQRDLSVSGNEVRELLGLSEE